MARCACGERSPREHSQFESDQRTSQIGDGVPDGRIGGSTPPAGAWDKLGQKGVKWGREMGVKRMIDFTPVSRPLFVPFVGRVSRPFHASSRTLTSNFTPLHASSRLKINNGTLGAFHALL
jgi:hypothetical protein